MEKLRKFLKNHENPSYGGLYTFGPYRVDTERRLVSRNGQHIPFSSKDFDLLLVLLEQPGKILVKEELMQRLWPDTAVEEGNLTRHISTLRKTLGESPGQHEYIVTVPGRGYRFVAAVKEPSGQTFPSPGTLKVHSVDSLGSEAAALTARTARELSPVSVPIYAPSGKHSLRWVWSALIVAAAVALGAAGTRLIQPRPILTNSDYVLISDFTNTTGDSVFDDTMKQAVSVQLAQSPFLNILSDARARATLKLMTKPPDTRLTPDVAREVCQRAEAKLYIAGSLAKLDNDYVIGIQAMDCRTGDAVAQQQAIARGKGDVLRALNQATARIRGTLGESLSSLEKYDAPQATTASLEALKAYAEGNLARDKKGDASAIPFFQHAIDLDPQFALAYNALGLTYSNLDEPGLASAHIAKAYSLRERTSELEKFHIVANYSQLVTGELEKANSVSELWAQTYPRDPYPHNLIGVNLEFLGQYEKAAVEILEAIHLHPDGVVLRSDLMDDYIAVGQLQQAKAVYQAALGLRLDHAYLHADLYAIAFLEQDRQEMDRQVGWAAGRPGAEDLLLSADADSSAFAGNLEKAGESSRRAVECALHNGQKETAALWQMNAALRQAEFGELVQARHQVQDGLNLASSRDVRILAALTLARAGDPTGARKIAEDLARSLPLNTVLNSYWLPAIRAAIELDHENPAGAIEILRAAAPYDLAYPNPQVGVGRLLYPPYLRGQAYLQLREPDKAIGEYSKFLDRPSIVVNCPLAALARLQLARSYSAIGNSAQAKTAYEAFFALWKAPGAHAPILKLAKKEYAKLL